MDDVRQMARRAAQLQLLADRYREHARQGAPEQWSLERQAAGLEALAASLLSLGTGGRRECLGAA